MWVTFTISCCHAHRNTTKNIFSTCFQIYFMGGFKDLPLLNFCIDFLQYSLILSQCGKKFFNPEETDLLLHRPPKQFLTKNPLKISSQKIPHKNFSKKFLQRNSFKKILLKNSQNIPRNIQKISKKFRRFWKYPISFIAPGGWKPFRACYPIKSPT